MQADLTSCTQAQIRLVFSRDTADNSRMGSIPTRKKTATFSRCEMAVKYGYCCIKHPDSATHAPNSSACDVSSSD
jgi:hypothetical protein